jgi:GAF domain-containing protein/HAMP domain-containing protein
MTHTSRLQPRRSLSIRTRLGITIGPLLGLVMLVSLSAYLALGSMERQATQALDVEMRSRVLIEQIRAEHAQLRTVEHGFLLGWQREGYSQAREAAIGPHTQHVREIQSACEQLIALLQSHPQPNQEAIQDVQAIQAATSWSEERFITAIQLSRALGHEQEGYLANLTRRAWSLGELLARTQEPSLLALHVDMRYREGFYLSTRSPKHLDDLRASASQLRVAMDEAAVPVSAYSMLDQYVEELSNVQDGLEQLDAVEASLDGFDRDVQGLVDDLSRFSEQQTEQALQRIGQAHRAANVALAVGVIAGLGLGVLGVLWLGASLTGALNRLRDTINALAGGDMTARAPITGDDEFSLLGHAINGLAVQLEARLGELEESLAARARDLTATIEISRSITALRDPTILMEQAIELISERFNFYHAQVFLIDPTGTRAELVASTGEAGHALLAQRHNLPVGSQSVVGQVTASGEALVVEDTETSAIHRPNPWLPDTRAEMALPLRLGERIIGALNVQSTQPYAFDEQDITVFQAIADQLVLAIENARLFDEARAALAEIEVLNRRLTGQAWTAYTAQRDPTTQPIFRFGQPTPDQDEASLAQAIQSGQLVTADDGEDIALAVPIKVRGQVIGAFGFGGERLRDLSDDDLALIQAVAERVGLALENLRLFEQTQRQAQREQLVNQITAKIVGSTDVNDILQTAVRELGQVLKAPQTRVQLWQERDDEQQ